MEMDMYKYQPIDLDRPAVRLVRLLRGDVTDEIQCDLFDGWIDQFGGGIPYDALSYTWGSTEKAAKITVNGSMMHVTSNLFTALQHLRLKDEDRILWIDAICIDQNNPHEREHQVQHMSHIYKEAERVVIWLGLGNEDTDFVMDSIMRLHRNNVKIEGDWRLSAQLWMNDRVVLHPNPEVRIIRLEGMKSILERPWFSRIWIVQEIANARVATVLCGKKSVSARTFAQFPSLIGLHPGPQYQAILDIMPGLSRKESWWSDKRDLQTLLVKFRGSLATDERDIIYALLGISSDACSGDILRPDYTKSVEQVIRDTVSFLLGHTNQDELFYGFLNWTLPEFLQNLDSLSSAVLGLASEKGDEEAVKLLLSTDGVNVDEKDKNGLTPLQRAITSKKNAIVQLLLENGAKLETKDEDVRMPLSWAATSRNEAMVELLLEKGANLEAGDNNGRTLLSWAAENKNKSKFELLLEKGANLEARDDNGRTPLSWASTSRNKAKFELLLEKGANLEAKDNNGRTPLLLAAKSRNKAILELLLEKSANLEARDNNGQTPLSWTAKSGNKAILEILLEKGANLEARDDDFQTPLSLAARSGNKTIVELLLEKGADIEAKDRMGRTPLSWAATRGDEDILRLLLKMGANLEAEDNSGRSPLSWAAMSWNRSVVELLIEKGANLEAEDNHGQTPLMLAEKKGEAYIAELLPTYESRKI